MSALANLTTTLTAAVADAATVVVGYPAGSTQATLTGSTGGQVVINGDKYDQGAGGATFVFGVSDITITNDTGVTWALGSELIASFGSYPYKGSFNLTLGTEDGQAVAA